MQQGHQDSSRTVVVPELFGIRDQFCGKKHFSWAEEDGGDGFRMIHTLH